FALRQQSQGGYVQGIHEKYVERELEFVIDDIDDTLYQTIKAYRETHGKKQLFIAWETANNPTDVWLMMPTNRFRNPFKLGGAYRTANFSFAGRKA
ncbi:unnamed protein product, partial [marine sediment metagenome]